MNRLSPGQTAGTESILKNSGSFLPLRCVFARPFSSVSAFSDTSEHALQARVKRKRQVPEPQRSFLRTENRPKNRL